jgi:hypothetical protein
VAGAKPHARVGRRFSEAVGCSGAHDMTFAINVLGWIGVAALLYAYWLVSTQKATGNSRTYQGMNLFGAMLVLVNSLYFGAYPSVGVNAAWIAIGAYTLAKHVSHAMIRGRYSGAHRHRRTTA